MDGVNGSNGDFDGVKKLKAKLLPWREIVLHANAILIWEKPFFPGIIAGVLSIVYLILYCMDMSTLTMFSLLGALALLVDYCVPLVAPKVFDPSKWDGAQEKKFEAICEKLSKMSHCMCKGCSYITDAKENRPVLFLASSVLVLLALSWLGSVLNGFFMAWFASLFLLMLPGFKQHGILDNVTQLIASKVKKQ